nr:receptor-like protein 12 [Ipomoea batatas]
MGKVESQRSVFDRLGSNPKTSKRKSIHDRLGTVQDMNNNASHHAEVESSKRLRSMVPSRMRRETDIHISSGEVFKVQPQTIVHTRVQKGKNEESIGSSDDVLPPHGEEASSFHITLCDETPIEGKDAEEAPHDTLLSNEDEEIYVTLLKEYIDVFAWTYKEMPGLDPKCLPDQKSVLLQIRTEITYNSSESTKLVLWDEGGDCCRWPGLSCNAATGYITSLDLSDDKSITGGFNVSLLYKLPSLSVIRLDEVKFSAPFPDFFTDFTNLTVLSLAECNFSGTVPHKLSKLVELSLYENSFSGPIPASLFFLPSLQTLSLSWNKLSGHINDFQNVTSPLELLDLSNNNLEGTIPSFFFQLQNLTLLYLSSNKFNGIIHLTKFKSQYIDIDFSNNNLVIETTISTSELPLLPQFGELDLASCNLQKIPDFLKSQSKLSWLDLSNNTISGEIPNWIWGIGNGQLSGLNLSHNSLTHMKEPMEYGSLQFLDLNSNMLSGQIPRPPPEAKYLDFSNNNFSIIPLDFADQIPDVYFFSIAKNRVSGKISTSCGHLPTDLFLALKAILVERNELNSKADYLHFTQKLVYYQDSVILSLKGQTYTIEKILSIFTSIDFSSNQFEGSIPESVGELKQLYLLNISHNALTGNIPPSLQNLKALEALDLSFNNLTGNIPVQLEILTFLEVLNLSYNHLVGRIPRSTQLDTFDASSFMGNKGLCGFQINVSCTGMDEPASPIPESEEKQSTHHADLYISVAFGFVAGLGGIFVPLLLSSKWRSYYNKMIDEILSKIFFQRGQGRRKKSR